MKVKKSKKKPNPLPNDFRFSKSSVMQLQQCPYKFKLRKVDGIEEPRTEWSAYADHGTKIHKEIEDYLISKKYAQNSKDFINFLAWYEFLGSPLVVGVEKELTAENLLGFVDAVFLTPDKTGYMIIDWKSGKRKTKNQMKEEMAYYHLLLEANKEEFPLPVKEWCMYFTKTAEEVCSEPDEEFVKKAKDSIKKGLQVKQFRTNIGFHCNFCGYKSQHCPKYKEKKK